LDVTIEVLKCVDEYVKNRIPKYVKLEGKVYLVGDHIATVADAEADAADNDAEAAENCEATSESTAN